MARMINADALQELCNKRIKDTWNSKTAPVSWAEAYADFKDDINSIPAFAQPGKPLTLEQLREMDGQPAWCEDVGRWAIVSVSDAGKWKGVPFALFVRDGGRFEWDIEDHGLCMHPYPPAQQRWIKEANTPPTNGDHVRAMDNKELSKWLCSIMTGECCDMTCPGREFCEPGHKGLLDWLQAIYKEEN